MTREEAITLINQMRGFTFYTDDRAKTRMALGMAIEALKTDIVRCKDCKHGYRTDDSAFVHCSEHDDIEHEEDFYCGWGESW